MLVYRQKLPNVTPPPFTDTDIPKPILDHLTSEYERFAKIKAEFESQKLCSTITIYRNRIELPKKKLKVDNKQTLKQILAQVIELVKNESK